MTAKSGGRREVIGVDGEKLVGADQGDGDERNSGFDRHEGAAGLEGLEVAGLGSASLPGKRSSGIPDLRVATPRPRLAIMERLSFESTGTWPERLRYQPMKGIFQRPALARMRNWKGSFSEEDRVYRSS